MADEEDKGIVRWMHKRGKPVAAIVQYTGLGVDEVKRICKDVDHRERQRERMNARIAAMKPIGMEEMGARRTDAELANAAYVQAVGVPGSVARPGRAPVTRP